MLAAGILVDKHVHIHNALLSMYLKCGALKEAQEMFDRLPVRNDVSWNILIAACVHHSLNDRALELFGRMQEEGFFPDSITFTCILKACGNLKLAKMGQNVHGEVCPQRSLLKNVVLGTALVSMYAKCGMLTEAQEAFHDLPARDVVSWNALIDGYVQQGLVDEAILLCGRMKRDGVSPDFVTFVSILKGCTDLKCNDIHPENSKDIIGMSVRYGALSKAREVLDGLPVQDVVSWNMLIDAYVQHGCNVEAMICYSEMQEKGITPDVITFACTLKACGNLILCEEGEAIHVEINKRGLLKDNTVLATSLVDMYVKCGMLRKAKEVFDKIPKKDVVSWTALISGYTQQGLGHEALQCFQKMQDEGVSPDSITFTCILEACGSIGSINIGGEVHKEIKSLGLLIGNIVLCTALVDMYAKCGALTRAQEVFDGIVTQDVALWNALISGYAQLGKVKKVLCLFNCMLAENLTANSITFGAFLTVCNHAGLVEEGGICFDMINSGYFLDPDLQLSICIVDLFCRSGNFDKAMLVIESVPISSRFRMWVAFLVACRNWVNVELGEMVFDHLVQLDHRYSGGYVCMSNLYAAAGIQESNFCE
jgi:pentatricopeptide repeat protein